MTLSRLTWKLCSVPAVCLLLAVAARADALADAGLKVKVPWAVQFHARAFPLHDVRLLDGPLQHARELDRNYLLSLDVDRLLHMFRLNAGLPSSAQPLGGWEEPKCEVRGHFVGHYLSACALMYAATGDARLKQKGDAIVAGMAQCQAKIGSGYLSAFPENFFDRLEARQEVWVPYYTLHKIMAGLLEMYVHCDNRQALDVCKRLGDWIIARNHRLSDAQLQKILETEHGGMNESLAELYAVTGAGKYLAIAQRFNHMAVLGPARDGQDKLTGLHANTQIPKFVGAARQFELTGADWLKTASLFFWHNVAERRSYVIGGHSDGEMFTPVDKLSEALGENTTETCNTYNMLKLTRHLFCWEPRAEYADFYERALWNHILASQHPETGMMCYYARLRSGSRKEYNTPCDSFWCCTGTGVENHAKYTDSIYFHDNQKGLYVNLFIASELDWKAQGVKVRQETRYPEQGASRLVLNCRQPVELSLHVRHPWWATEGFEIRLNGQKYAERSAPASYVTVTRTWTSGDTLDIVMPMRLHTEGFRDNPRRIAFLYGPIVLCADMNPQKPLPATLADLASAVAALRPVVGKPLTFAGSAGSFQTVEPVTITLTPYYKMHGERRYMVYWDALTPDQWQDRTRAWQELAARTVDHVCPHQAQSEQEHKIHGEHTETGDWQGHGWRHATDGGWFSWEVRVLPNKPQQLQVSYWGSDNGNRVFDILLDGQRIAAQRLQNNRPNTLYEEIYPIAAELTKGKERMTVRFQAQRGATAGGVFGVRVLKERQKD